MKTQRAERRSAVTVADKDQLEPNILPLVALDQKLMKFSGVRRLLAACRPFDLSGNAVRQLAESIKALLNIFESEIWIVRRVRVDFDTRTRWQLFEIKFDAMPLAAINPAIERLAVPMTCFLIRSINRLWDRRVVPRAALAIKDAFRGSCSSHLRRFDRRIALLHKREVFAFSFTLAAKNLQMLRQRKDPPATL